jgi:hypothetical protein
MHLQCRPDVPVPDRSARLTVHRAKLPSPRDRIQGSRSLFHSSRLPLPPLGICSHLPGASLYGQCVGAGMGSELIPR